MMLVPALSTHAAPLMRRRVSDPLAGLGFVLLMRTYDENFAPLGMYQDEDCTIPAAADFDPIAAFRDEYTGSAYKVTQSDPDKQPYFYNQDGIPTILFDGVDDCLQGSDGAVVSMGSGVSFTVGVRVFPDITGFTDGSFKALVAKGGINGNEEWLFALRGTGFNAGTFEALIYDGASAKVFQSQTILDDSWQTAWTWLDEGTEIGVARDDGAGATSATAVFARDDTNPFRIGAATNFGGLNFYLTAAVSHVFIAKRVLSEAERALVHDTIS